MILSKKGKLAVHTITEEDFGVVLKYFSENDFNCRGESASLRPSNTQFMCIMKDIVSKKDDESNIFVLKKHNKTIGYVSMFVEYDKLVIGHIAIDKSERGKGYGSYLTSVAVDVADHMGRDVRLFCSHPDPVFRKLGFDTHDNVHFYHERKKHILNPNKYPPLFVDKETYSKRASERQKQEVERFSRFLNSGIMDALNNLDGHYM
ncbi:MAG: GNAT family N-acetyltransferase [Clostridia bacterium]|nr:GNAT family N-acetyltransferase [Clostridia bacterium]